jgi:hypothetical protein
MPARRWPPPPETGPWFPILGFHLPGAVIDNPVAALRACSNLTLSGSTCL